MTPSDARRDAQHPPTDRQDAAVLVPVFRDAGGELRLVLVRRAAGGLHGGQLAFPGGPRESSDASPVETALREAHEEIGLAREAAVVLAALPAIETMISGFRVAPFLARITPPPRWIPAEREIAEVLEVRVADFARPEARGESVERFPAWLEPCRIPYFQVGAHRLWGATYRIVEPLIPRLLAGEWPI
jgi:8-oxo-dGTP pyrophosphatase MutT (NUDIX family)